MFVANLVQGVLCCLDGKLVRPSVSKIRIRLKITWLCRFFSSLFVLSHVIIYGYFLGCYIESSISMV